MILDIQYILKGVAVKKMNTESNFVLKKVTGLEVIGGLRKLEDLRNPFIIPASIYFTGFVSGGPLIKGSRDSATAANYFTALIFWFVLHQGKMNRQINFNYMFLITDPQRLP